MKTLLRVKPMGYGCYCVINRFATKATDLDAALEIALANLAAVRNGGAK